MATTRMSYLTIMLLLSLASLCTFSTAADVDGSDMDVAGAGLDATRRERAAATIDELLTVHNDARQAVGVPPLTWSAQIAGYAKSFAQSRRHDCAPRRSPLFYFGENMFVGKGRHWNTKALAAAWVEERQWYDYESNSCAASQGCARYTQVVWRNTTQLGCARIVCDSGDTMLVCDYFPPGNYGTGRPY